MIIKMLPFGDTKEIAKANLMAIEKMLEQKEEVERRQKQEWDALPDAEKNRRYIAPLLAAGIRQCPRCKAIASPWRSLAEGHGFYAVIPGFDKPECERLLALNKTEPCASRHPVHASEKRNQLQDMRFDTQKACIQFWNSLIT